MRGIERMRKTEGNEVAWGRLSSCEYGQRINGHINRERWDEGGILKKKN